MQATLNIDDEVLSTARDLGARREVPLDTVVNDLLRTALRPQIVYSTQLGMPVFVLPEGSPPIDPEKIQKALDEDF